MKALDTIQLRYESDLQRGKDYLDLTETRSRGGEAGGQGGGEAGAGARARGARGEAGGEGGGEGGDEDVRVTQQQEEGEGQQHWQWQRQQQRQQQQQPSLSLSLPSASPSLPSASPSLPSASQSLYQSSLQQIQYPLMTTYDDVTREVTQWKRLLRIYSFDHPPATATAAMRLKQNTIQNNTELFLRKLATAWMRLGKLCFHDSINSQLIDSGAVPFLLLDLLFFPSSISCLSSTPSSTSTSFCYYCSSSISCSSPSFCCSSSCTPSSSSCAHLSLYASQITPSLLDLLKQSKPLCQLLSLQIIQLLDL
jgi:hypothetical protein